MTIERFGPTRRGGPLFRWLGEPLAIDLANTVMVVRDGETVDLVATQDDFRSWLEAESERLGSYAFEPAHLEPIHSLRDSLRELFGAVASGADVPPTALDRVNAASAGMPVAPQLEAEAGALVASERAPEEGAIEWLLAALARSAIAILAGPEKDMLKVCRAPSCGMFFIGARRWCCAACGNRARAARHYRRIRESAG